MRFSVRERRPVESGSQPYGALAAHGRPRPLVYPRRDGHGGDRNVWRRRIAMARSVVAFVPMKMTNARLAGKHLLPLAGRPLLVHIFQSLLRVPGLAAIYAWTSDDSVCEHLPPGVTFLRRDTRFDGSTVKGLELFGGFATDVFADLYLLAHATAPFLRPETMRRGLDGVLTGEYDSALSVRRIQTYCWFGGRPVNYELTDMARTQDLQPIFVETSGFYLFSRNEILGRHRRIGDRPLFVEVGEWEAIDIDYAEDFAMARRFEDLLAAPR
jgi:CMP-N-acetylneuraminic acid synthetase